MNLKKLLLVLIVVAVLGAGGFYFYIQSILKGGTTDTGPIDPKYNYSVLETGVVDYGETNLRSMYISFASDAQDMICLNSTALLFRDPPPPDIYLLDYPCIECNGLKSGEFTDALESSLKHYGYIPQDSTITILKINQLERLGKKGILIVPTGRLPSPLLDYGSDANILELMKLGSVVIYIGNDFSQTLNRDGVVERAPDGAAAGMGLVTTPARGVSANLPYRFESASYKIPSAREGTMEVAGAIQVVRFAEGGYFVAFPNTIDIGWSRSGGKAAGEDVARFISGISWQVPLSSGTFNRTAGGTIGSEVSTLFMLATERNEGAVRLFVTAQATNRSLYYRHYDMNITNNITGRLRNSPFGVNGSTINLAIRFEAGENESKDFEAFLAAYKDLEEVDRQSIGVVKFIGGSDENRRYTVNLVGGNHILKIHDISGRTYAQSFLHIPLVTLRAVSQDWNKPALTFRLLSDDVPVPNTPISISVSGLPPKSLVTGGDGTFVYEPGQALSHGTHNVTANATGRSFVVTVNRRRQESFFDQTQNQVIIGGIVIVLALGILLRRGEVPVYHIDIPNFPPQQKDIVPLPKSTFINLIDTINREYRWKYMPLSLQEIKKGMQKRILYKGKPVLISDYNLEKVLGGLVDSGELTRSNGLYGLSAWGKVAGKGPEYLSIFRSLRNYLINNAMLFTDVGQRQDCDILINYRGENLFLHIYDGDDAVRRALTNARKGRNFIVFADAESLMEFKEKLTKATTRMSVALEMEMDNRQVILTHLGALGVLMGRAS